MQKQLIRGLLVVCANAGALGFGQGAMAASPYVVDGITLAKSLWLPRAYQCSPSGQFAQHSWCQLSRREKGSRGAFTATTSVLRDEDRTVAYVSREIAPAFFGADDIEAEIKRLSSRLGAPAREIRLPAREGGPKAVIVTWGKLQLDELTAKDHSREGAGSPEQSLLVDYIGDVQQSRRLGLPVFRIRGGAGYLWSASDRNGRGHLRFLAADPAALGSENVPQALGSKPTPTRAEEIADPTAKNHARIAVSGGNAGPAVKEATGSIKGQDLRPFLAPQQAAVLSGGAANQELSYPKDSSRVSVVQKPQFDTARGRIMDAEHAAAEEREKARLAWARFEAERAADARARLKWTVVAAFFMLSAILALLQMLRRREEESALPQAAAKPEKEAAAGSDGLVERTYDQVEGVLMRLRVAFGFAPRLAAQGQG